MKNISEDDKQELRRLDLAVEEMWNKLLENKSEHPMAEGVCIVEWIYVLEYERLRDKRELFWQQL
ncbi:MAG: hypothetical protein KAT79_07450, partial [candidate division Zixibacteria bacterium]|nr:hypothetical protein [candidate division Zixibacteria bacterium]